MRVRITTQNHNWYNQCPDKDSNLARSIYNSQIVLVPVAVSEPSKALIVFDRSEAVIAGLNPALGMDV
jgi:hypothetical protein